MTIIKKSNNNLKLAGFLIGGALFLIITTTVVQQIVGIANPKAAFEKFYYTVDYDIELYNSINSTNSQLILAKITRNTFPSKSHISHYTYVNHIYLQDKPLVTFPTTWLNNTNCQINYEVINSCTDTEGNIWYLRMPYSKGSANNTTLIIYIAVIILGILLSEWFYYRKPKKGYNS